MMTAQQLLDELVNLQKQGFDLESLEVQATKLCLSKLTFFVDTSFGINSVEVDDLKLVLYNE